MRENALLCGSDPLEVLLGLPKAEAAIWAAQNALRVWLILPIIFPKADRTDVVSASLI